MSLRILEILREGSVFTQSCHAELDWLLLPKSFDFVQNVWFSTASISFVKNITISTDSEKDNFKMSLRILEILGEGQSFRSAESPGPFFRAFIYRGFEDSHFKSN